MCKIIAILSVKLTATYESNLIWIFVWKNNARWIKMISEPSKWWNIPTISFVSHKEDYEAFLTRGILGQLP